MDNAETGSLSREEKVSLLSGQDLWRTKALPAAGIRSITLTDGPHGLRYQGEAGDHLGLTGSQPATCFPPAVAVGSSWDPAVARAIGAALAAEATALGVDVVLGPGVNIKRSPLCGRNFEYYSEDPLLSGVLGAAHVRGLEDNGVGSSVKHFAANNQETDRMSVSAEVDERTLREIYLPAFERVVTEARPATVMCAYNRLNGTFAAEHPWLLTRVLREEWGFDGVVVSDWGAVHDRVAALAAGLDLQMPYDGGAGDEAVVDALRRGEIGDDTVDVAVGRLLRLVRRGERTAAPVDWDAHHALARSLGPPCMVLLKNEGPVLPLRGGETVAVVGAFATRPRFQGGGSSKVAPARVDVPLDEITAAAVARGGRVVHAPGFPAHAAEADVAARDEAVALAGTAAVTVVFAGLPDGAESEGYDRRSLELPAAQVALIRAVAAAARRTVVVLAHGGVVSLEGWHEHVDAILDTFLLGQAGGGAIADVLFGVAEPSGRLAESIPRRLRDTAAFLNFPGELGSVRYGEGVMVGYRYHVTAQIPARYPFGHGLGYGRVETSDLRVQPAGADGAHVEVDLRNVGDRETSHVVQLYVATQAGPVRRASRELRAFEKVRLAPGQTTTVTFDLDRRAFAYWDVRHGRWVVAAGDYGIQIGRDAQTVLLEQSLTLAGDHIVPVLSIDSLIGDWFSHPAVGPSMEKALRTALAPLAADFAGTEPPEALGGEADPLRAIPLRQLLDLLGGALPAGGLDEVRRIAVSHLAAAFARA
ncbi:glycoside hydrolase family 3 C-terminal domain-containing protein [Pseudofrankia inefficax]|uniref:Glycoside hydrolase family 3 domain protein n=1 Tax=Pseudofrankia inefficax (strain DSM 45817 / CECT 9037 / DDB 130130 / EuI1c) TaxID=298654 RepID=E3IXX5_PSEI1|nr:glycoside hydrolase family 3 C-terminal domain-containing protein [Pseudofrankia inefficax]ADP81430.1 glycoside hydrolase family 3 domain protein [Pseudofrankia inefficax]